MIFQLYFREEMICTAFFPLHLYCKTEKNVARRTCQTCKKITWGKKQQYDMTAIETEDKVPRKFKKIKF